MDEGQNYTAFSSRGLLDMIGDLNDKALEASRMKDFIGVLGGRFLQLGSAKVSVPTPSWNQVLRIGNGCLCPLDSMRRVLVVLRSGPRQCDAACKRPHLQEVRRPHCPPMGANARTEVVHCNGRMHNFGGPYFQSYNILEGVDTVIPVDVYIPGCPPRPEALIDGFGKLREKIIRIGAVPSEETEARGAPIIVADD